MAKTRYPFGERLRRVRERRKLTMKQVAAEVGVSESLISQIERDRVSPSLDTLLSMADVLQVDLDYLFEDYKKVPQVSIVRKNQRNSRVQDQVCYEELSRFSEQGDQHGIEAFLITITQGEEKGDQEYGHPGRELGFLLKGKAELIYGKEEYKLEEGDSISFSSEIPHRLINTGKEELQALWVITPPRLFTKS
ncbi:MAG: XRE family transcriptional regulator [Spirochaetaceae bacterium]|jgi:transcriptional regulator with XRE-family HTH domain|nr:XRE family transcriptional regulator [Spirochaetaceae bacterium]